MCTPITLFQHNIRQGVCYGIEFRQWLGLAFLTQYVGYPYEPHAAMLREVAVNAAGDLRGG
jgi:hypothetical protein